MNISITDQEFPLCGAKTRRGTACRCPAMQNGKCRIHGGRSLNGKDHPGYKHGKHTKQHKAGRRLLRMVKQAFFGG